MSTRMQYQPPVSGMGGQRLPPIPPPKPRMFEARMPHDYEGRMKGDPSAPPGDSDTDSGICADSEQSSSPSSQQPSSAVSYHPQQLYRSRPAQQQQSSYAPQQQHQQLYQQPHHGGGAPTVTAGAPYTTGLHHQRPPPPLRYESAFADDDHRDYLTPNSARRLFDGLAVSSASPRRLPARPTSANGASAPPPRAAAPMAPGGAGAHAATNGSGTLGRAPGANGKQYRVRFADQIAAPATGSAAMAGATLVPQTPSFSSSLTSSPSTSTASPTLRNGYDHQPQQHQPTMSNGYGKRAMLNAPRAQSVMTTSVPSMKLSDSPQFVNYDLVNDRRADSSRGYSVDDVEGLPEPPSYNIALQRMRSDGGAVVEERGRSRSRREQETGWSSVSQPRRESVRDTIIRQSLEDTMRQREFEREQREPLYHRNRSASLPRGHRRSEGEIQPLWRHQISPSALASSVDNLMLDDYGLDGYAPNYAENCGSLQRRRCLPPLPADPNGQAAAAAAAANGGYGRRPAYSRGRRCRGVTELINRRSASVGRYPSMERIEAVQYPPPAQLQMVPQPVPIGRYPSMERAEEVPVRAQLIALDHRGFRTVLIEKVQPGPFGFYIATGVVNGQRGIFISRVSISTLSPILSIGDEILYVDDELVKGRSLEYVQSLIAGKTSVMIVLLPTVGPAVC